MIQIGKYKTILPKQKIILRTIKSTIITSQTPNMMSSVSTKQAVIRPKGLHIHRIIFQNGGIRINKDVHQLFTCFGNGCSRKVRQSLWEEKESGGGKGGK